MGLFVLACVFLVSSTNAFAEESVVDQVNITIPTSCSLSGTGMDTHNTTIHNNESDSAIGESIITAYCNDINGFSIYAIGFTNDEDGNNYLTDSNLDSTSNIPTGTATTGATSSWAMKLTPVTSPTPTYPITIIGSIDDTDKTATTPDYTAFQPVPNKYALVARRKAATDVGANAEGSSFKTTYQAYASPSQLAGTYTGQVKYTLIHPYDAEAPLSPETTASGKICYYPNGSNVDGTMGCQTIPTSGTTDGVSPTSATLLASNFSRTGYGFAGWSNKFDYATNPNQEGIKFYGPQETITYENGQYVGEGKGLSLYAVWVKSAGNLQDTTKVATLCGTGTGSLIKANEATNILSQSITALSDSRDNNTYAIAKLADGNCWMIENLRLESTNSDNSTGALAQGYGTSTTYGNFSGLADAESTGFTSTYTANSLYYSGTQEGTASIDISIFNSPAHRMPHYNNLNTQNRATNPAGNTFLSGNTKGGMYSYGNYYTWHAAIADLTYNGTNNKSTTSTSLCPTGWHLPTGGSVTTSVNVTETPSTWREFYNLGYGIMGSVANDSNAGTYAYYNNTTTNSSGDTATKAFRKFPNNFLYSGYFEASSASSRGDCGGYWSSTAYSNVSSYILYLHSSRVYPGTNGYNKYRGFSIRCTVSAGT